MGTLGLEFKAVSLWDELDYLHLIFPAFLEGADGQAVVIVGVVGKIEGIDDLVSFEGSSVTELKSSFE